MLCPRCGDNLVVVMEEAMGEMLACEKCGWEGDNDWSHPSDQFDGIQQAHEVFH